MTDLSTLMTRATADIGSPTAASIDDDMARAQRAQRARRKRLGAGGFGGAAAVAALAVGFSFVGGGAPASAVDLVEYTGTQPQGFTLAEVPEAWHLYVSDDSSLVLSPLDDPSVHDSAAGLVALEGRISISVVSGKFLPDSLQPRDLVIDGTTARAYDMLDASDAPSGVVSVFVAEGEGRYLSVQLPDDHNWTDTEISRFIEGIEVAEQAPPTDG